MLVHWLIPFLRAVLLAAVVLPGEGALAPALAQTATQKGEAVPGGSAAPQLRVHRPSGLVLPPTLLGARLVRVTDYAASPTSNPRLGVSYHYAGPGPSYYSVFAYDNGEKPGDGPEDAWVQGHIQMAQREMMEVAQTQGRYQGLRPAAPTEACGPASFRFLCAVYATHVQGRPYFTAVLLTGWHGHYVKVRADWPEEAGGPGLAGTLLEELARAQAAVAPGGARQ